MFLECEAVVFLVGVAITTKGRSEHDCRVFSSTSRKCSTNHGGSSEDSDIAVTTIYDRNGDVVLKWHGSTISFEGQSTLAPTAYNHLVPESEWGLQPIFWKRRKRQLRRHRKRLRGTLATCNCTVRGYVKPSKRHGNKLEYTTRAKPRQQGNQNRPRQTKSTECMNGFRPRYGVASPDIELGLIIKRVTAKSPGQCANMCENEFVTQIDCVAIAYSDLQSPNCILLSSLPKTRARKSEYTIYTNKGGRSGRAPLFRNGLLHFVGPCP